MKPKITIIVDVPGWALDNTASNVAAQLIDHYDFERIFNRDAGEKIRLGNFDLLYITYWRQFNDESF